MIYQWSLSYFNLNCAFSPPLEKINTVVTQRDGRKPSVTLSRALLHFCRCLVLTQDELLCHPSAKMEVIQFSSICFTGTNFISGEIAVSQRALTMPGRRAENSLALSLWFVANSIFSSFHFLLFSSPLLSPLLLSSLCLLFSSLLSYFPPLSSTLFFFCPLLPTFSPLLLSSCVSACVRLSLCFNLKPVRLY